MTKQIGDYFIAAIVGITVGSLLLFVADRAISGTNFPVTETIVPVTEVVIEIEQVKSDCVEVVEYDMNTGMKTTIGCVTKEST